MSLPLDKFHPVSRLVTPATKIHKPRFRIFDAHNHLGPAFGGGWDTKPVAQLQAQLDQSDVDHYVDLDGGWSETILDERLRKFKEADPEKFILFGTPNWQLWQETGSRFGEVSSRRLRAQVARGAEGLKIWKDFGLHVKDETGTRVAIDDERIDPLWQTAAELNIPVLIHIADPVAFFDPLDETNERWDELHAHPDWHFPAPQFLPFSELIEAFARLVRKWKTVTFIGAHVACYSENLGWVRKLMQECPNLIVDFSARISELGRQPFAARQFFIDHADRILFGTDSGPDTDTYRTYFRFLESADEYFSYCPPWRSAKAGTMANLRTEPP